MSRTVHISTHCSSHPIWCSKGKKCFFFSSKSYNEEFSVVYIFWNEEKKIDVEIYHRSKPILLIGKKSACAEIRLENGKIITLGLCVALNSLSFWWICEWDILDFGWNLNICYEVHFWYLNLSLHRLLRWLCYRCDRYNISR